MITLNRTLENFAIPHNPTAYQGAGGQTRLEQQVAEFYNLDPVRTGGAINEYKPTFLEEDDGDCFVTVTLPVWCNNEFVTSGVLNTVRRFREHWGHQCHFYARDNAILLRIYFSWCDGE